MKVLPAGSDVTLITNQGRGFLSNWTGRKVTISYTKHDGKALRFLSLSGWYLQTLWFLLIKLKRGDILVLSTLISSPLLAVRMLRPVAQVRLLVNEVYFRVPFWRRIGLRLARSEGVLKCYPSHFVRDAWSFPGPYEIAYPRLRQELLVAADGLDRSRSINPKSLKFFLVASHIEAKGYELFIEIARHFEQLENDHRFHLYLSGSKARFDTEFPSGNLPTNLAVIFNNASPQIFMGHDIFLGLTNPDLWIETFGLTFAEAMMMGNIIIVPPVGAQLEYVNDGDNGFVFRDYSLAGILEQITRILEHKKIHALGNQARQSMLKFYATQLPDRNNSNTKTD
jgi:glycosyltransferase involved in cell wall biosynthesis